MNGPGHQFLTGAGLPTQQYGTGAVQDLADQRVDLAHSRASTDQAIVTGARWADRQRRLIRAEPAQTPQQMQLVDDERAEQAK